MTWVLVGAVCLLALGALSAGVTAQDDGGNVTVETEPNDDRANATPIETGASGIINNTIDRQNGTVTRADVDFFRFEASAGQAINLYAGRFMFPELTLITPDGETMRLVTNEPATTTIGTIADETGTYYVRAAAPETLDSSLEYEFDVELVAPDSFEPNDDRGAATSIEAGERIDGVMAKNDTAIRSSRTTSSMRRHRSSRASESRGPSWMANGTSSRSKPTPVRTSPPASRWVISRRTIQATSPLTFSPRTANGSTNRQRTTWVARRTAPT
ncbi:hypothetical protein BRC80_08140 [Halobacteriales archaeon QH_9_66_26]|nr:MAG: hypothetical protein BRC80_08140 [Halobacteriales archaeon QH_9_66_26]